MKAQRQRLLTRWLIQHTEREKKNLSRIVVVGWSSAVVLMLQFFLLAALLYGSIHSMYPAPRIALYSGLFLLLGLLRVWLLGYKNRLSHAIAIRIKTALREQIIDRLRFIGPCGIETASTGSWNTLLLERVEELHAFFSHYLIQRYLVMVVPATVLILLIPISWVSAAALIITAPLIPLFMILVGTGAAQASQRNWDALIQLGSYFADQLRGIETLRLFYHYSNTEANLQQRSEAFRKKTMEVLQLAFLSSGVLEFFTALSIAFIALYFGFTYLGLMNFSQLDTGITLFSGLCVLLLAPEFYQPLRDLGANYHAKMHALAAAESLYDFFHTDFIHLPTAGTQKLPTNGLGLSLCAKNWVILSMQGEQLTAPLNFTINAGEKIIIFGQSGAGKTLIFCGILGFLPYKGSLLCNGIELKELAIDSLRHVITSVTQQPQLLSGTIKSNLLLGTKPPIDDSRLKHLLQLTGTDHWLLKFPNGLSEAIQENNTGISAGELQRLAIVRALLKPALLRLFDEPLTHLDSKSALTLRSVLADDQHATTLLISHPRTILPIAIDAIDQAWELCNRALTIYTNEAIVQRLSRRAC